MKSGKTQLVGTIEAPGQRPSNVRMTVEELNPQFEGYRSQNLSRDTTTTLATDDDMDVSFDADTYYYYEAILRPSSTSATPDFKYDWNMPVGTLVGNFWQHSIETGTGNEDMEAGVFGSGPFTIALSAGNSTVVVIKGVFHMDVGGIMEFQWAQNTSDATATVLNGGSFQRLTKLGPVKT